MTAEIAIQNDGQFISTHTLTWSVTDGAFNVGAIKYISTHTLTWSVTFTSSLRPEDLKISTHTLTWSVTPTYEITSFRHLHFNSHAHVERDP